MPIAGGFIAVRQSACVSGWTGQRVSRRGRNDVGDNIESIINNAVRTAAALHVASQQTGNENVFESSVSARAKAATVRD